ncbi:glycoside hydrolase family 10 protein [Streptomyces sp. GS7]|uniref:glycoside hydrolase family 10 protein n=1 Tax=Streptomyces sp. GS7 TaxID=2692234 RepID=UPI001916A2EE|nr:family 10 glycosylhydrolase [Streptomyces sp. GS7]
MTRRGFGAAAAGAASWLLAPGTKAGADGVVRREMRGMWLATVANLDWPSKPGLRRAEQQRELVELLDVAVERRLGAVFFQVRPTADALWPSPYEPWAQCLTGTQGRDPGWDPLGFAVHEAHRRDLELHAWFNPYRVANHADPGRLAPGHPARRHPRWVVPYGGKLYYNPGLPEVRRFVQDAMLDAVRHYPVDGVHFDDYFYPYPVAGESFCDDAAYEEYGADFVHRGDWRRANTDRLVRGMSERLGRRVRFGVSPFAVWRNRTTDPRGSRTEAGVQTYDDLYADTRRWVREGWIDYIVPQVYWPLGFPAADYAELVSWWARTAAGTEVDVYIGEALYKAGRTADPAAWRNPAELSRHVAFARRYPQIGGHVYFSAKDVVRDPLGALARVVRDHYGGAAR